jgi:dipeptidyl aminopeptidase/acylaminoacyl peptidase
MHMHLRAGLVASVVALSVVWFSETAFAIPPVEAFGNIPVVNDVALAPDGKHIAIIRPLNGRPGVTIFQLDAPNAQPQSFGLPNGNARSIYWANNTRLICHFTTNAKLRGTTYLVQPGRFISLATDGGKPAVMLSDMPKDNYWGAEFAGQDATDPNHIFLETAETAEAVEEKGTSHIMDSQTGTDQFVAKQYYWDLFKVDVTDGTSELIQQGDRDTVGFITDKAGHPVARFDDTEDLVRHLYVGDTETFSFDISNGHSPFTIQDGLENGSTFTVTAFGPDNLLGLYEYKLGDKQPGAAIFTVPQYDIDGIIPGERGRGVIGVSYTADRTEYKYFDLTREQIEERLKRALPDQSVYLGTRDVTGSTYVVEADGPKHPTTYYLFTPASGQLSPIASAYPNLTANDLGEETPYPYKSSDGLDIHAYLTLPPGKTPKNLPTVIYPHGGPWDRDKIQFDWWPQFMASRGYAVLQPNFRSSTGYGSSFRDAGDGQWAGKVQDDITDGVKKLIADGIADPKRICIVGWSYGGYAALAGATFHSDLYACAISYAGPADLARMLDDEAKYHGDHSAALAFWSGRMGAHRSDGDKLAAMSPASHADQVKAPILLIHSTNDVTVLLDQSQVEESALKSAGKSVEFVQLDGDDHYLTLAATRIQLLKEVEKFLSAHIGN